MHDIDAEALLGGVVHIVYTSGAPVLGCTVNGRHVGRGFFIAAKGGIHVNVKGVLGVLLPVGVSGGGEAASLAGVGEPVDLPIVLLGEELHEGATEHRVPDIDTEAGGGG